MHHDVNQTKDIKGISDALIAHLPGTSLQGTQAIEAPLARRGAALTPDKNFDPISLTVRLWHKADAQIAPPECRLLTRLRHSRSCISKSVAAFTKSPTVLYAEYRANEGFVANLR